MIATAPRLSEPMTRALLMLAANPGQVVNLHVSVCTGLARRGVLGPTYRLTEVGQDLAASLLDVAELFAELHHEPSSAHVIRSSWSDRHAAIVTRVMRRDSQPIARFEFEGHSAANNRTRFVPANRLPDLAPVDYGPELGELEPGCPTEPARIEPEPYAYTQLGRKQYAHTIPSRCCGELLQRPGRSVAGDPWSCMACRKSYLDARALADGLLMAALPNTWGLSLDPQPSDVRE